MSSFYRVIVWCVLVMVVLLGTGCAQNRNNHLVNEGDDLALYSELQDRRWQVEDIDNLGVIDYSMITMSFDDVNRISGSTGCNQYSGELFISGNAISVSKLVTTRRACAPAITNQEQRFIQAIERAATYQIESEIWLLIYDQEGNQILKLIPSSRQTDNVTSQSDSKFETQHSFNCVGLGKIDIRILNTDTIIVDVNNKLAKLHSERKASGAFYVGTIAPESLSVSNTRDVEANISFWNKGKKAILVLGSKEFSCNEIV